MVSYYARARPLLMRKCSISQLHHSLDHSTTTPQSPLTIYMLAVAAIGAAVLVRYLLDPWNWATRCRSSRSSERSPLRVRIGGVRPAIAVVILGFAAAITCSFSPGASSKAVLPDRLARSRYSVTCGLIIRVW